MLRKPAVPSVGLRDTSIRLFDVDRWPSLGSHDRLPACLTFPELWYEHQQLWGSAIQFFGLRLE